jgi:hypothetical protein
LAAVLFSPLARSQKVNGKVQAVENGLAFVKLEDGKICWLEVLTGSVDIGDTLRGNLRTLGRREVVNESQNRTMSVLVQCCL